MNDAMKDSLENKYSQLDSLAGELGLDTTDVESGEALGVPGYMVLDEGAGFAGTIVGRGSEKVKGQDVDYVVLDGRTTAFRAFGEEITVAPYPFEGKFKVSLRTAVADLKKPIYDERFVFGRIGESRLSRNGFEYYDMTVKVLAAGEAPKFRAPLNRKLRLAAPPKEAAPTRIAEPAMAGGEEHHEPEKKVKKK